MLVSTIFGVTVLLAALIGAIIYVGYRTKRRVDRARPRSELRPGERPTTPRPDLTNPIHQPERTGREWPASTHRTV